MKRKENKRELIADLLQDLGFDEAESYEGGLDTIPTWAYEIAEKLIDAGWRPNADARGSEEV
jgi:hypothetical protein